MTMKLIRVTCFPPIFKISGFDSDPHRTVASPGDVCRHAILRPADDLVPRDTCSPECLSLASFPFIRNLSRMSFTRILTVPFPVSWFNL